MTSAVAPAPSATLLRFLRFQAGAQRAGHVFFSPNLHCGAPFTPNLRHGGGGVVAITSTSTSASRGAAMGLQQADAPAAAAMMTTTTTTTQPAMVFARLAEFGKTVHGQIRPAAAVAAVASPMTVPVAVPVAARMLQASPLPTTGLAMRAKALTAWMLAARRRDSENAIAISTPHAAVARRGYASGDARPWMQRLAELAGPHNAKELAKLGELRPEDLPGSYGAHDPMGTIFGRSKAAMELKLRCTEFDEYGKVVIVNGEFKKSELIAKYGLQPRDLRKIDSSTLPSILVRPSSILVNLLHLRVLIQHNRVLIFDAWGSSNTYAQSMFMYDLEGKLGSKEGSAGHLPYEFRALEAVLVSVTSGLEGEFEGIREPVSHVLRELEEDIDRDKLRHLLVYSKKLGTFEQKARLVRDAVDAVLEEDEDLSAMYLTEKAHDIRREIEDHTEIEMLLESYHKVSDEIVQGSGNLVTNIRNTEEIIRAILDANRNALMLLDLKFSIGTLGIGSGAFVAALYGMNLKNYMEESALGFASVTGLGVGLVALVCMYGMSKLRRVQRLRMWGERGLSNRGSWRDLDNTAGLPGEKRADRMRRLKEERLAAWQSRHKLAEEARCEHPAVRG